VIDRALKLRTCLFALAALAGCYRFATPGPPVDAREAPQEAWRRLAQLESFGFRLAYHTDTPLSFGADFSGVWHSPDREYWSGVWRRGDKLERVEFRASGEAQYERRGGAWQRSNRGMETDILKQVEQVVAGKQMVLRDSAAGVYRYEFKPWLPVLDPSRQREFSGLLEVNRSSGLPLRVHARDNDASAEWEAGFGRFNRAGDVGIPFVAEMEVVLAPEKRMSRSELGRSVVVLRQRLDFAGWEHRLYRRCGKLVLALGRTPPVRHLNLLLSCGRVELWTVVRAEASDETAIMVGEDPSFRVLLKRPVAANGDFEIEVRSEPLPEAVLQFESDRILPVSGDTLLALVVDGLVVDCIGKAEFGRAVFAGSVDRESASVLAALGSNRVNSTGFRILESR